MIIYGVTPIGALAVILGIAVWWDRTREPHRDPTRPMAVVDNRTYRDAQRRIQRLLDAGDTRHARNLIHAICIWLRNEVNTGRKSRRVQRAADLEQWQLRLEKLPIG